MIQVTHRSDQLLQRSASSECPDHLKKTFIGRVTKPSHVALVEFLDENIVDHEFDDENALKRALSAWPQFYAQKVKQTDKGFGEIFLGEDFIATPGGVGGNLVVGHIVRA